MLPDKTALYTHGTSKPAQGDSWQTRATQIRTAATRGVSMVKEIPSGLRCYKLMAMVFTSGLVLLLLTQHPNPESTSPLLNRTASMAVTP